MKKHIIIPYDFAPLYALRERLGPQFGPIKEPIPVEVSVIHDLLMQRNKDRLHIFEVKLTNGKLRQEYCDPVRLTLKNYNLSYDEIVSQQSNEESENEEKESVTDEEKEVTQENDIEVDNSPIKSEIIQPETETIASTPSVEDKIGESQEENKSDSPRIDSIDVLSIDETESEEQSVEKKEVTTKEQSSVNSSGRVASTNVKRIGRKK